MNNLSNVVAGGLGAAAHPPGGAASDLTSTISTSLTSNNIT